MSLSIKNGWVDDENRAFIYFTTNDVMEQMWCGTEKATKLLAELDVEKGIGLIERKKQGQGKPAIVYLKKFYVDDNGNDRNARLSEIEIPDFRKSKVKTFENRNTRLSEVESADFREPKCNYNKYNNTYVNDTEKSYTERNDTEITSYPINRVNCNTSPSPVVKGIDTMRWIEKRQTYEKIIKNNIDYDIIVNNYSKAWLDEIVVVKCFFTY